MGMVINKWDVLLVNQDPTIGSEIQKTRPGVVISPPEINKFWNPIIIIPLTSKIRNLDFRTRIKFQGREGQVAIDQMKAIDKKRIVKNIGTLQKKDCKNIHQDLMIFLRKEDTA